ncbi:MAG: von Willebrand factor type A domain-containing protein [Myxococcota bacterium]
MKSIDDILRDMPRHTPSASVVAETLQRVAEDPGAAPLEERRVLAMVREQRVFARWTLAYAFGLTAAFVGFVLWHTGHGGLGDKPRVLDGSAARVLTSAAGASRSANTIANVRRYLEAGELPPVPLVQTDAIVDYFQYTDVDSEGSAPVRVGMSSMPAPWDPSKKLVRLGVVGRERSWGEHTPTSLAIAVDAAAVNKSGVTRDLARSALGALVATLGEQDTIAIMDVGRSGQMVLTSTNGGKHELINEALAVLFATQRERRPLSSEAVQRAYQVARSTSGFGRVGHVLLVGAGGMRLDTQDLSERLVSYVRNGVRTSMLTLGETTVDVQLAELVGDDVHADLRELAEVREQFLDPMMRTMLPAARNVDVQLLASKGRVHPLSEASLPQLGAGQVMTALYEVEGEPELTVRIGFQRLETGRAERAEVAVADIPESATDDDKVAAAAAAFAFALQSARPSEAYAYLDGAETLLAGTRLPAIADERDRRMELSRMVGQAREIICSPGLDSPSCATR